jgi:hypothetical protein
MRRANYATVARWPRDQENPHDNIVVRVKNRAWELESKAGDSDDVHVLLDGEYAYILSSSSRYGYLGISKYLLKETEFEEHQQSGDDSDYVSIEPANEFFTQSTDEITDLLGPRGLELSPVTIINKLSEYLG